MGIRFLIVDDSSFSRVVMRKVIEGHRNVLPKSGAVVVGESKIVVQADWEVIGEAANGEEAVEQYRALNPDIVMMDITMPKMDGLDALKRIMDINSEACVIMVTALREKSRVIEAVKIGAKGYVVKPIDQEAIYASIEKSLLF